MTRHYVKLTYALTRETHINPIPSVCFTDEKRMINRLNACKYGFGAIMLHRQFPNAKCSPSRLGEIAEELGMTSNMTVEFFDKETED